MTRYTSPAWEELGARQRERQDGGGRSAPRTYKPRPQWKDDPDLLSYPKENDFTRWLAEENRKKAGQ